MLDKDEVKFEPDLPEFQTYMKGIVDLITEAVQEVPRVETKLYSEKPFGDKNASNLHPIILSNLTEEAKTHITGQG